MTGESLLGEGAAVPDGGSGLVAWLFVSDAVLPERWRDRAVRMSLVPLLPAELSSLLPETDPGGERGLSEADARLAQLVARGRPRREIARTLGISVRTLDRRLMVLRQLLGADSLAGLTAELGRRGFGR